MTLVRRGVLAAVLVGSWLAVPAAHAGTSPPICGDQVGGMTIAHLTVERHTTCPLLGPGTLTIAPGGTFELGQPVLEDGLTILNQGTATQFGRSRPLLVQDTSVFENAASFTAGLDASIGGDSTALALNDAGATWYAHGNSSTISIPFRNDGDLFVDHGVLYVRDLTNLSSDGVLTDGTYHLDHSTLVVPRALTTNDADLVIGPSSQLHDLAGADALASLTDNSGTLALEAPQVIDQLTNSGTLALTAHAALNSSGPISFTPSSGLQISVAKGAKYGTVHTGGTVSVGGALTIATDPAAYPVPGSTYTLVSAAGGVSGTFSSMDGLTLPDGDHYEVRYTATAVTLVVVSGHTIPLRITKVLPTTVGQGATTQIAISGAGFVPGALVGFGDSSVLATSSTVVNNTRIIANVAVDPGAATGNRDVKVRNPGAGAGVAVCSNCLHIRVAPAITSTSGPIAIGASASIGLTGTGLVSGASASLEGPAGSTFTGSVTTTSDTVGTLQLVVPPGAALGTYSVRLINPDGGVGGCSACVTVIAPPTVTALSPSTVGRGNTVTLTVAGTGFSSDAHVTGPSGVRFGAATVVDSTELTVQITVTGRTAPGTGKAITVVDGPLGGYGAGSFTGLTIT